jgi:predicted PilT family ATPase
VSDEVKVKGPGNCVDQAIAMIREYLDDLIAQVTESVEVEKHFHGEIIGKGGKQVQELQNEFNVSIKFPSKGEESTDEMNLIQISGRKEKIDLARAAIIALIPITREYPLEAIFHADLIGKSGAGLQELTKEFNINIKVPQKPTEGEEPTNSITLIGKVELVESVIEVLDEKKKKWEEDAEDRKLRNYSENIQVDGIFHSKIIGHKGERINKLREEHVGVNVNFPKDKNDVRIE